MIDVSAAIKGDKFAGGEGLGQISCTTIPNSRPASRRKLFAYGRGENSEDVSASAFKASYKAFTDSGYHLKTLIKGMAASPEFYGAPTPFRRNNLTRDQGRGPITGDSHEA